MQSANFATFEPYEILGISYGASEREIKKAYRGLSKKWHPDMHPSDTRDDAEQKFMLITKAYYALTDPTTRDNYERYGNPDGQQGPASMTYGLPTFLSEKKYEVYVLIAYLVLFITIPLYLFYKFFGAPGKTFSDTGVMTETVQWFMGEMGPEMSAKQLVEVTSLANEFRSAFSSTQPTPERMEALKTIFPKLQGLPQHKHAKIFYIMYGNSLFHAWLQNVEIPACSQEDQRIYLQNAPKLHALIAEISRSNRGLKPYFGAIDLIQSTIQKVPLDFPHPFLQFVGPDFTENNVKDLLMKKITTLNQLTAAKREEVIKITGMKESSYDVLMKHMAILPKVKLDIKASVQGCEIAQPKDVLKIEFTLQRIYNDPSFLNTTEAIVFPSPPNNGNGGNNSIVDGKEIKLSKEEKKAQKKAELLEKINNWEVYVEKKSKSTPHTKENVPNVVSNFYPFPKKEVWYIALIWNHKGREFLVDSRIINNFSDTDEPYHGEMLIQLHSEAGLSQYRLAVRCDSYLGCDMAKLIKVNITDPKAEKREEKKKEKMKKAMELIKNSKNKKSGPEIEVIEEEDVDTGIITTKNVKKDGGSGDNDDDDGLLKPGDIDPDNLDDNDDENLDKDDDSDEDDELFDDEIEKDDDEEQPTYWYYLWGSTFWEGVLNLVVFTVLGFLFYHYCHNMAWWKKFIVPVLNKISIFIKPYWILFEKNIVPIFQPAWVRFEEFLRWFLEGNDSMPMEIKLEKAARGRFR